MANEDLQYKDATLKRWPQFGGYPSQKWNVEKLSNYLKVHTENGGSIWIFLWNWNCTALYINLEYGFLVLISEWN